MLVWPTSISIPKAKTFNAVIAPRYSCVGERHIDRMIKKLERLTPKNPSREEIHYGRYTSYVVLANEQLNTKDCSLQKNNWQQNSHLYIFVVGKILLIYENIKMDYISS